MINLYDKLRKMFYKRIDNIFLLLTSLILLGGSIILMAQNTMLFSLPISFGPRKIEIIFFISLITFLIFLWDLFKNPPNTSLLIGKIFIALLPAELVFLFAMNNLGKFGYLPNRNTVGILISLYLILAGLYFIFRYKKYKKISDLFLHKKEGATKEKLSWLATIVVILVILINCVFGLYRLSKFAAVDEPLWTHDRIPSFWRNVGEADFGKTNISDKPGITVAILSGAGLLKVNPFYYKNSAWEGIDIENLKNIEEMNFALRFPIFIFNSLMLVVFYFFIKKLFDRRVALISVIFIGCSPLLIGISSIINPDSLLWVFTPLSLIAYLIYQRDHSDKYLYLSGFFLGLAILTKYVANILYVFFFGLIFLNYIICKHKENDMSLAEYLKKTLLDYASLVIISLVTFLILLPAAWLNIGYLLKGTLFSQAFAKVWPVFLGIILLIVLDIKLTKSKVMSFILNFLVKWKNLIVTFFFGLFLLAMAATVSNVYTGMKIFNFESILASPKSSSDIGSFISIMLANFYSLIFGLNPWALAALIFLAAFGLKYKNQGHSEISSSFFIFLFILFYYLASSVEAVSATVRYQIILYPLAFILASVGLNRFFGAVMKNKNTTRGFTILITLVIVASVYSLFSIKPFYFSYASDLLPKKYVLNLKDMGDGSYEAAQYLNSLPNPDKLVVWTDKKGVCVFFRGTCLGGLKFDSSSRFDYFVVSSGREARTTNMTKGKAQAGDLISSIVNRSYNSNEYEYKIEIGGRPNNFVKIISNNKSKE
jgi:4-amino-4-deoxy-L-arabinose transferase-like glycosyltransferase